jgi:multiple sugar transport system substrate-binding protein
MPKMALLGLRRRRFLAFAGAALSGAVLLPRHAFAANAELRMSWWGPTQRHQAYLSALSLFQSMGTDKVRASYGGFQGYFEKLQTEMAGGAAPDVFQIRGGPPPVDFIDRGVLLDLTPHIGGGLKTDDLETSVFESVRYNGKIYEVPQGVGSTALYINKTMLEEFGGALPAAGWTWDDFAVLARTISDNSPEGVYGATDVWAPGEGAPAAFQVFVRQRGKELYTEDGQLGIERSDLADWLAFWADLRANGAATPPDITAGANASDGTSTLITRQAAMFFSFTGILVGLQELTTDQLVPHLFPDGPAGSRPGQNLEADGPLAVSAQTRYPDEAVALLNFLINDPQVDELIGTANGVPISARRRAALRPMASGAEQLDFDYIDQVSAHSTPLGIVPPAGANELENSVLQRVHEDVAFERQTIDEGVETFFSEATRLLS